MSSMIASKQTPLMSGIVWNICSLGFLALAGLFLNFAIARFYGSQVLGVFNVAFALYIFASQFGVFGIHLSIMQHVSAHYNDPENDISESSTAALLLTTLVSTVVTIIVFFAIPWVVEFYGDRAVGIGKACYAILPGLWAFSINKVLYSIINGARMMRTFAVLSALRYVFMLLSFFVMIMIDIPGEYLTIVFSFSELALIVILFYFATKTIGRWRIRDLWAFVKNHIWFGSRVFMSGAVLELNTRVDVLMIAYFLNAKMAGIYTIAALIAEGVGRLVFAVRTNFNPIIGRAVKTGEPDGLLSLSRKSVILFPGLMLFVSIIAYLLFPLFCKLMFNDPDYLQSQFPLAILLMGITASSGLLTFNMILSQAKRPASHTIFVMIVLSVNIVINLICVPRFGIVGAAIGTSVSFIVSGLLTLILARVLLKIRLVF